MHGHFKIFAIFILMSSTFSNSLLFSTNGQFVIQEEDIDDDYDEDEDVLILEEDADDEEPQN